MSKIVLVVSTLERLAVDHDRPAVELYTNTLHAQVRDRMSEACHESTTSLFFFKLPSI